MSLIPRVYCGALNLCVFSQENRRSLVKLSDVVHGSLKYCLYVTCKYSLLCFLYFFKVYFATPVVLAVRNISVAIQKQECFGLLGLNGAGKTTTFQILTGEEVASSGDVFVEHLSITKNILKVRHHYCLRCEKHDLWVKVRSSLWEMIDMNHGRH